MWTGKQCDYLRAANPNGKLSDVRERSWADTLLFEKPPTSAEQPRNLKLWQRLLEIESFDKNDQDAVLRLIDAMIAKRKIRDVIGNK